jgi:hypothetical protein
MLDHLHVYLHVFPGTFMKLVEDSPLLVSRTKRRHQVPAFSKHPLALVTTLLQRFFHHRAYVRQNVCQIVHGRAPHFSGFGDAAVCQHARVDQRDRFEFDIANNVPEGRITTDFSARPHYPHGSDNGPRGAIQLVSVPVFAPFQRRIQRSWCQCHRQCERCFRHSGTAIIQPSAEYPFRCARRALRASYCSRTVATVLARLGSYSLITSALWLPYIAVCLPHARRRFGCDGLHAVV